MTATRTFVSVHATEFLVALSSNDVANHIWMLDERLAARRLQMPASPYTTASLIVPAALHHWEARRDADARWEGFDDPLTAGQLLRMIWSFDDLAVSLLGLGDYITEYSRRGLMFRGEWETAAIAHRVRQICVATSRPVTNPTDDLAVLLPSAWRRHAATGP